MSRQALIVIDLQNDYFPGGRYPLWNADATLDTVEAAILDARSANVPVVLVQHVADASKGVAPFFNAGTPGVEIHTRILAAAPDAPIVVKTAADSFHHTSLEQTLSALDVDTLLICGMMTQNCVTHTAISKAAEKYTVKVLRDGCTTVDQMIHGIALSGLSTRIPLIESESAF
ncbi:cysteine hydrolase family protein [Paraburkholderia sp.]|uniref:cysteine hydrolase family protein n=1 Tax=Paraburkholderia sp. TaxID=1926495 RepID=UPI0023955219|nr:cysteine hydrolase family protein [Paraburkholderia sp.]MDE1179368.1 cysteine hydrolase family protein [Paraburkholderia sp.]